MDTTTHTTYALALPSPQPSPVPPPTAPSLLEGFRLLLTFLVEEEANYLCGVSLRARSPKRMNYRMGYYKRWLRTHLGTITLRIPHLLYLYPRTSIIKRAKRLSPVVLETLARVRASGATPDETSVLIKTLWTLELPDEHLAARVEKLTPILDQWRNEHTPPPPPA